MPNKPANVVLGKFLSPLVPASAGGNVAFNGVRSFSQLLQAGAARLRGFVFNASPGHPTFAPASLQDGTAALQRPEFCTGQAFHCALCTSGHPEPARLARLVGSLPIGLKIVLPVLSKLLGERFGVVNQDLIYLVEVLHLPIQHKKNRTVLLKSFPICQNCAQIGAQFRQTYSFQAHFKAAPLGTAGLTCRVQSAGSQGEPPDLLTKSG